MDLVQGFNDTISNKNVLPCVKDRLVWKKNTGGLFPIKSCFDFLEGDGQFSAPRGCCGTLTSLLKYDFLLGKFGETEYLL